MPKSIRIENSPSGTLYARPKYAARLVRKGRAEWVQPGAVIRLVRPMDPTQRGYDVAAVTGQAGVNELANTPVVAPEKLLGFGRRKGASKSTFDTKVRKVQRAMLCRPHEDAEIVEFPQAGPGRQKHLARIAKAVVRDYEDPEVRVHDLYAKFKISWEELDWILDQCGVPRRTIQTHRKPAPIPRIPHVHAWRDISDEERVSLYRRAWGPAWPEFCVARGY